MLRTLSRVKARPGYSTGVGSESTSATPAYTPIGYATYARCLLSGDQLGTFIVPWPPNTSTCLLYTSDAADE